MNHATAPRILTTTVGSYPVPEWLAALPSEQALLDATRVVFDLQRQAGVDLPTDGELYRFDVNHPDTNGMIDYFVSRLGGIDSQVGRRETAAFRAKPEMRFRGKPAGVVTGPITEGALNLPEDCARAASVAGGPFKFTLTSPYMLARTLLDEHYRNFENLTLAIADALAAQAGELNCACVQVDEANIPGNPANAPLAATAINRVLDAVRGELPPPTLVTHTGHEPGSAGILAGESPGPLEIRRQGCQRSQAQGHGRKAVHFCFGNYGGQTIQKGTWAALLSFLNSLHADHLVLELAHRPASDLEALKEVDPRIGIGLGVVDIKVNHIETPEEIARAIVRAEKVLGPNRVRYVHPDCGFWMLKRSVADRKIAALVKGRDLYLGRT